MSVLPCLAPAALIQGLVLLLDIWVGLNVLREPDELTLPSLLGARPPICANCLLRTFGLGFDAQIGHQPTLVHSSLAMHSVS